MSADRRAKSTHTSDEFLQDFLDPAFDPASYLNSTLPPLSRRAETGGSGVSLAELSSQAQTLLLQLNTQTTRLSSTLTQLTDEMLRSGSRLAYEVELLRGEALSLEETMAERLKGEMGLFIPDGTDAATKDPPPVAQLQTLTLVRARLDAVVKVFGDAMEFVFPPSEVSLSSGFLSVSAPEPGAEQKSSEEKGQQVLRGIREEIASLLEDDKDPVGGVERAAERVGALKELAGVWRGTAEEKGRMRFVEGLARMVEERHRELMRGVDRRGHARGGSGVDDGRGFGLISQLQKLRGGVM